MGKVWGPDAVAKNVSTSFYGNIVALAESPKKEGLLYAGTDDGLIQVTEDGGKTWRKIEKFPGVPERTYVSRIAGLAARRGHRLRCVRPSQERRTSRRICSRAPTPARPGTPIKGDLPANGSVLAIAEDHVNPHLLFAGTEFGLFFTIDGGKKWMRLKGGMPTIACATWRSRGR